MKKLILIIALSIASNFCLQADPMATDTVWTKHFGVAVQSVVFSPDGQYVYTGAEWRYPKKIDVATGETVMEYNFRQLNLVKDYYYDLEITDDGQFLAVSTGDVGQVSILHTETGEVYKNFDVPEEYKERWEHSIYISSIDLSPDFTKIAVCTGGWTSQREALILIYDIATGEILQTFQGSTVYRIEYSPDGSKLAYIGSFGDGFVGYYNTETWESEYLGNHSIQGKDIAFSPDGSKLASCGSDGYIKIWDVGENKLGNEIKASNEQYSLRAVTFSPNSDYILASVQIGGDDWARLYIYNLESGLSTYSYLLNYLSYIYGNEYGDFIGSVSVSSNSSKIMAGGSIGLYMLNAQWNETSVQENSIIITEPQVFPNPNNSISTINLELLSTDLIEIVMINQEGVEIGKVYSGILEEGEHNFTWDGSKHPSGVYYCKITGRNINETLKIIKVE